MYAHVACVCNFLHTQRHACQAHDPWNCMTAAYTVTSECPPSQKGQKSDPSYSGVLTTPGAYM